MERYLKIALLAVLYITLASGCASKRPYEPVAAARPVPATDSMPTTAPAAQPAPAPAPRLIELQQNAPQTYIVKKGDTLWDIAKTFLDKPWYWPEIWYVNPEIKNPHLIYPGDVISLYYVDGKPRLGVNRTIGMQKLSPSIRTEKLNEQEIGIPISAIRPFVIRPEVVSEEQLASAPHVLDSQDARLIYGSHDLVYVHGLKHPVVGERYSVFRPGKALLDPETGELLGHEAVHASDAVVTRTGKLATVELEKTVREVLRGDRLLPLTPELEGMYFIPHSPPPGVKGQVISIVDALSQSAQYQVAVVNLGYRDKVEPGQVLAVLESGRTVIDPYDNNRDRPPVFTLPTEQVGLMMIFRSFEKVSYALIMESARPVRKGYTVTAP
ncbi:MAG: LysM peptidoglycan-binding domain-containing protein [Thiotrichales bacterium]